MTCEPKPPLTGQSRSLISSTVPLKVALSRRIVLWHGPVHIGSLCGNHRLAYCDDCNHQNNDAPFHGRSSFRRVRHTIPSAWLDYGPDGSQGHMMPVTLRCDRRQTPREQALSE